jgi:hypothetical protein
MSAPVAVADVAAALADVASCWRCLCDGVNASAEELDAAILELRRTLQIGDVLGVCDGCGRDTLLYRLR